MSPFYHFKKTRKSKRKFSRTNQYPIVPLVSGSLKPGTDFYKYVNHKWLDTVHVPPYSSSYGISEEIEEIIDTQVIKLINTDNSEISTFAESARKQSSQHHSLKTLHRIIRKLECIRDENDITRILGNLAKYKIRSLLWIYGEYTNIDGETIYQLNIGVGSVGLQDVSYYNKSAPGKGRTLLQYANLLEKIGNDFDIDNLSSIVTTESDIALIIQKSITEDKTQIIGKKLVTEYPGIPWDIFFESVGIAKWETTRFFIDSKRWVKAVQLFIKELPLDTWRHLFATEILFHFLPSLPGPYDTYYFEFFRKRLRGQSKKIPEKGFVLGLIKDWMTPFISRVYVEKIVPSHLKKEACLFVEELVTAAKHRLSLTDWLSEKTRKLAQEKVDKMRRVIAYPDSFGSLKAPQLEPTNLLENILAMGEWRTSYEIGRIGEKLKNQKDWDESVFAVNAYYFSGANEIVIPTGSLYWPFFKKDAPLGWNYGGLGAAVGHEMTHAFDNDGKEFDQNGIRNKWWTPSDTKAYDKKSKELVDLFNKQKVLGHPINGLLTLDENIADLGGLAIALDALSMRLEKEKDVVKKQAYRQFFISYAVSWRVKDKPEKMLQSLFLDRHAPASYRVNLVVSQFQEWYDAFDINEKDPFYIPPEKRIRIF